MEVNGKVHALAILLLENICQYPLNGRLDGPLNVKKKISYSCQELNARWSNL
jgi:hypothetical protein